MPPGGLAPGFDPAARISAVLGTGEPAPLPEGLAWRTLDLRRDLSEIAALLAAHYVSDADETTRIVPPAASVAWMCAAPDQPPDWLLGCCAGEELIGVICATPLRVRVRGIVAELARVNLLCLRPDRRGTGITPLLVRELTRRIVSTGVRAALYMGPGLSGFRDHLVRIPRARWLLDPYPVIDAGLLRMSPAAAAQHVIKDALQAPLRPMRPDDVPAACAFLQAQAADAVLCPVLSEAQLAHWLLPRPGIVSTFLRREGGAVVELTSTYQRELAVRGRRRRLKIASSIIHLSTARPLPALLGDALVLARRDAAALLDAALVGRHGAALATLRRPCLGRGHLDYHLFNWPTIPPAPGEIGFTLPL